MEKNHLSHNYLCSDWYQDRVDSLGQFAVGCDDGSVIVWDLGRGVTVNNIVNGSKRVSSVVFSNDGQYLLVSDEENLVHQYLLSTSELVKSFKAGKGNVKQMIMNPKTDVIAVCRYLIPFLYINFCIIVIC